MPSINIFYIELYYILHTTIVLLYYVDVGVSEYFFLNNSLKNLEPVICLSVKSYVNYI